ncbi:Serine/threonine protein kinase [Nonomuraea pusilla]|uniref:Serine/threonine protein kinase n=1 Tax=Nonomuraea pusilla TaxID=46177 RepID=A0A1H8HHM9_9ACTN|nr:Serine/threonine protein kinase [Nonomuraea pusilla]
MSAGLNSAGLPRQIGPYRVVKRLGAGGMGVVYAGVDEAGVRAAVKVIHPALAEDQEFQARFAREIGVVRRVGGVCIAKVLAADAGGPAPWLATEYVPGPTLERRVLDGGPLSGDELYGLAGGLAEALTAMHEAGVVHRDLKPSNVLLSPSGPRVVDFGIAKLLDQTSITRTGTMTGSPGWVSPEEYRGEDAGPAADVHGWGLLVCYAATGRAPFGRARPEVLAMRVIGDTPDTSAVPAGLRDVVDRALAKEPEARPGAHELLEAAAAQWCGANDEEPSAAAEDVTRLLTRTWPTTVEPQPEPDSMWVDAQALASASPRPDPSDQPARPAPARFSSPPAPSPSGPGTVPTGAAARTGTRSSPPRRDYGPLKRAAGVLVVIAAFVGLFVLKPSRPSPGDVATAFLNRMAGTFALRFTGNGNVLTVTTNDFMLGEATVDGQRVRTLTVQGAHQSESFVRASDDFWWDHGDFFRPSGAAWGRSRELFATYMADFADKWLRISLGNETPWLPALFRRDSVPRPDFAAFNWLGSTLETAEVTIEGREAVKITSGSWQPGTYYVSKEAPHRILRFDLGGDEYDVTELTKSASADLIDDLGVAVRQLRDQAREADLGLPSPEWGRCDQSRCMAKVTFSPAHDLIGWSETVAVTYIHEAFDDGRKHGRVLRTCRKRTSKAALVNGSRVITCTADNASWRSWAAGRWGRGGAQPSMWAYLVRRPFSDAEVAVFASKLQIT